MATLAFSKLGKSTFSFLSFFAIHQELRLDFFSGENTDESLGS